MIKTSYVIASAIAIAAAAWVLSGQLAKEEAVAPAQASTAPAALPAHQLARVRVREQTAEPRVVEIVLRGQTQANRQVELRAETRGKVIAIPADKGATVDTDDVVARLSDDDRQARLAQAKALLAQRQIEYENAQKLSKKGYRPETDVAETRARLEEARAAVASMEIDIGYTSIRAPFAGVIETRPVEIGDFVNVGDPVATIVDLDPMLVVAHVAEKDVVHIKVGMPGRGHLVTGETVSGKVRFVGSTADAETRTFLVELEVPNRDHRIVQGISAELQLPVAELPAHRVSPAILSLTDDGKIGVKTLNAKNIVEFSDARIIGDGPDGIWLAGLPARVRFITVGQDFVMPGQQVEPVPDTAEPAS